MQLVTRVMRLVLWFFGVSSFLFLVMGPRAKWESTPDVPGLRLAYPEEIRQPLSVDQIPSEAFPVQQLHPSAKGITFATFATFEKISNIRTNGACLVVLAGYVKPKVLRLAVEDERVISTTITVKDVVQGCEEMRAATLVNLARDGDDFFTIPESESAVEVSHIERVAVFAEIRQCDATEEDWATFGDIEAFHSYVCQILEHHSDLSNVVLYKIFQREGYLCRRMQIPTVHRNAIYAQSGFKSVQFRAVRKPDDVLEAGLEVMKIPCHDSLTDAAAQFQAIRGGLGCFKSQSALYFRVLDDSIRTAREVIFADDERFTSFNIAAKCVYQYKIFGFPAGTSMKEVVKTLQVLGFVAIPSRIVNLRDLAIVFISAPQAPSAFRFQTSVGVIQIVELERRTFNRKENSMIAPVAFPPKGHRKGTGKDHHAAQTSAFVSPLSLPRPAAPLLPNPYAGRVEALETQVQALISDVDGLKKDNIDTKQQLTEISKNQDRGFKDLMQAISEIRAGIPSVSASSDAAPVHTPPPRLSPVPKHQKV